MAIVETDLGWAAEEDYLVYDAGTFLANISNEAEYYNRDFTKQQTGYALAAFVHDTVSGWYGPYLISTVSAYANYIVTEYDSRVITPGLMIRHYKRTWYLNTDWHIKNVDYTTSLPVVTFSSGSAVQNGLALLDIAGVQLYRTDKTWSFLAGMMCGLSGRALPRIGV